jgi:hypothetical protein
LLEKIDTIAAIVGGIIAFGFFLLTVLAFYAWIKSKIEVSKEALKRLKEAEKKYNIGDVIIFEKEPFFDLSWKVGEISKGYIIGFREKSIIGNSYWELKVIDEEERENQVALEKVEKVIGKITLQDK